VVVCGMHMVRGYSTALRYYIALALESAVILPALARVCVCAVCVALKSVLCLNFLTKRNCLKLKKRVEERLKNSK